MNLLPDFKRHFKDVIDPQPVDNAIIDKFSGTVPYVLVELWREDGWAGYMDGFIWTINPEEYMETALRWINLPQGQPILPILRTAFGDLVVWYEGWARMIDVRHHDLIPLHENLRSLFNFFLTADKHARKEMNAAYFGKALKKHGILQHDECYGFFPALALGGTEDISNLKKVKVKEHIEILTQLFEKME